MGFLSGCAPNHESTYRPDDGGTIPDTNSGAGAAPDTSTPNAGNNGGRADAGQVRSTTPPPPEANRYLDAPCAYPASISHDLNENTLLVTCGGVSNALFRSAPLGTRHANTWSEVGYVEGYPSHHIQLSDRYYLVNHSMPDGFTIIDGRAGSASDTVLFSDLDIKDSEGNELPFVPNNPAGAALVGGLICILSSNLDHIDMDPAFTTFHSGSVICFQYQGNGTVNRNTAKAYFTSGVNPTGMALIDNVPREDGMQRFAVLSSNKYAPAPGEEASLDIYTWPMMTRVTINLGEITAQISPTLAVTSGGMILIGVQRPAPSIIGVDVDYNNVVFNRGLPDVDNFVSSIQVWQPVAAVSDFGVFGEGGHILYVNFDPQGWEGVPITPLNGAAGPSLIVGNVLYQAVTNNSADGASVWLVNLEGLD